MEKIIIDALWQPLTSEIVKSLFGVLGENHKIKEGNEDHIRFGFNSGAIELVFDDQDRLIKVELNSMDFPTLPLHQEIIHKYNKQEQIEKQLGQPKLIYPKSQNPGMPQTTLIYELKQYWIRFELNAQVTVKIVYISPKAVAASYKNPEKVMRICKSIPKK